MYVACLLYEFHTYRSLLVIPLFELQNTLLQ